MLCRSSRRPGHAGIRVALRSRSARNLMDSSFKCEGQPGWSMHEKVNSSSSSKAPMHDPIPSLGRGRSRSRSPGRRARVATTPRRSFRTSVRARSVPSQACRVPPEHTCPHFLDLLPCMIPSMVWPRGPVTYKSYCLEGWSEWHRIASGKFAHFVHGCLFQLKIGFSPLVLASAVEMFHLFSCDGRFDKKSLKST